MFRKKLLSAFTLVELLIVIAVMGVLAGAVLVSINPADKLAQASDAKVQSDLSQVVSAVSTYVAEKGYYPAATGDFAGAGLQMESYPVAPTSPAGYAYTYNASTTAGAACTTAAKDCTRVWITSPLKSAKYTATPFQRGEAHTGKVCQVATAATACP